MSDLEIDALHVAQQVLEELAQVFQDVRLPGAGAAVQQPCRAGPPDCIRPASLQVAGSNIAKLPLPKPLS